MILELGGGFNPKHCKAFGNGINMDILDHQLVDIHHDIRKFPWPVEDNTTDLLYNKFVIEHVGWRNLLSFIKEMHRVVKPGGRVITIAPDLRRQMEYALRYSKWELDKEPASIVQMLYGDQNYEEDKWQWNAHASSCDEDLYRRLFIKAGFKYFHAEPLPIWNCDLEMVVIK